MNILCNEGDFWEKSVNEGDLDLPQGKHGYEGDWSKMREPPPKLGSVGSYAVTLWLKTENTGFEEITLFLALPRKIKFLLTVIFPCIFPYNVTKQQCN